jgi:hypothetical protein
MAIERAMVVSSTFDNRFADGGAFDVGVGVRRRPDEPVQRGRLPAQPGVPEAVGPGPDLLVPVPVPAEPAATGRVRPLAGEADDPVDGVVDADDPLRGAQSHRVLDLSFINGSDQISSQKLPMLRMPRPVVWA